MRDLDRREIGVGQLQRGEIALRQHLRADLRDRQRGQVAHAALCADCLRPQALLVEDRPRAVGIVEHRPAAREAGALVDAPGGGMPIAGLEHQSFEIPSRRASASISLDDLSADALALHLGPRVHPLHLADAVGMPAQRADSRRRGHPRAR